MPDNQTQGGDRDADPADSAGARLAALREDAAAVYAVIAAADEALRQLAARRIAAEAGLRHAAARHAAAARAAAAHARARPGPLAQLASRFRAGREWTEKRAALEAVQAAAEPPLAAARQALGQVKEEFAARVAARAEAAAVLRRLTAECAAAQQEIAAQREQAAAEPGAAAPPGLLAQG